ncbi:MAG: cytochrome b [Sedimenticolaceae bacterium]|nr:cytochrome b [Sedimenticolaceae bacterium]
MQLVNDTQGYGLVAILLHWLIALTVIGLFVLGLWMVELDYYDPWYRRAPALHKGIGVLLFLVVLLRMVWHWFNPRPQSIGKGGEVSLARLVHRILLILPLFVMFSGYLISTADGSSIDVFSLFEVPAIISNIEGQEDIAGDVHFVLAIILVAIVVLHMLAALKHHFIDRDATLRRMLGLPVRS